METYRIRFVDGSRTPCIELVREFMGVGLHAARTVVETRGVILDGISLDEAHRVRERFASAGAEVEVERTWRHIYAYALASPARGDQTIERLRVGAREVILDRGQLGDLRPGAPLRFDDESLVQARVVAQLDAWAAAGLAVAESEIAVLEAVSARDAALEAQLRVSPDDPATHLIYGDWLQAQGDPRGQLVMLAHARAQASGVAQRAALGARERDARREHRSHLFGPLAAAAEALVVRWSHGMVDAAFVGHTGANIGDPVQILRELLRLPVAARLTSLGLTSSLLRRSQLEGILCGSEVIAELRELELGDHIPSADHRRPMPRLTRLWRHLRGLRKLTLHSDQPPLRALHSATLEHLELHMLGLVEDFPEHFVAGRLPRLRTLTLDFASAEDISPGRFADLLALPELDGITELVLRLPNHPVPHGLAEVLASVPRLSTLELLDLSRCTVNARGMETLTYARARGRLPDGVVFPSLWA